MADRIVREAARRFACGEISEFDYELILVRNGHRPLKPKYDYQEFVKNEPDPNIWYIGRALPALESFLKKPAVILASDAVGDYQGVYYAVLAVINGPKYDGDTTFALWSDYYGSCGGCDAYEDASIEEQFDLIKSTMRNISQFWSLDDLKTFIERDRGGAEYYSYNECPLDIVDAAKKNLEERNESPSS